MLHQQDIPPLDTELLNGGPRSTQKRGRRLGANANPRARVPAPGGPELHQQQLMLEGETAASIKQLAIEKEAEANILKNNFGILLV